MFGIYGCVCYEYVDCLWVNVNVRVCDPVHKIKSVCLSAYVKRFHVYLLFDPRCYSRRSSVIVCNEPSRLGVDLF